MSHITPISLGFWSWVSTNVDCCIKDVLTSSQSGGIGSSKIYMILFKALAIIAFAAVTITASVPSVTPSVSVPPVTPSVSVPPVTTTAPTPPDPDASDIVMKAISKAFASNADSNEAFSRIIKPQFLGQLGSLKSSPS
ncbi:MAG: hypothetical protein J3R72DRAFT_525243 [Linnemannia gamsii]|nr:MAG: hypothetical protein J3R72DRAFT_525243 [Linnemannia gamsii]